MKKPIKLEGGLGDITFQLHTQKILECYDMYDIHVTSNNEDAAKFLPLATFWPWGFLPDLPWHKPEIRDHLEPLKWKSFGPGFCAFPEGSLYIFPNAGLDIKSIPDYLTQLLMAEMPRACRFPESFLRTSPWLTYGMIQYCKGIITAHSYANMVAWLLQKPQFIVMNRKHYDESVKPILAVDPTHYGWSHPKTTHVFMDWPPDMILAEFRTWKQGLD